MIMRPSQQGARQAMVCRGAGGSITGGGTAISSRARAILALPVALASNP
jgi:hypothetical protein